MADYSPCFHSGKNPVLINEKGGSIEWRFFTEIFQIIVIFYPHEAHCVWDTHIGLGILEALWLRKTVIVDILYVSF